MVTIRISYCACLVTLSSELVEDVTSANTLWVQFWTTSCFLKGFVYFFFPLPQWLLDTAEWIHHNRMRYCGSLTTRVVYTASMFYIDKKLINQNVNGERLI